MNKKMRAVVSLIGLCLFFSLSGCGSEDVAQSDQNEEAAPSPQSDLNVENVLDEIDPDQAIAFVNDSGLLPDGVVIGHDSKIFQLDFTQDGTQDLCIVTPADGGQLSPVAFVSQDQSTGQLVYIPSTLYADTDFTIEVEGDFIVRSQADGSGQIKQLYMYSQDEGIFPLLNGSFMTGLQNSVENYHEKTQFIYENSLIQSKTYYDFTLNEETFFLDEKEDKHHFASKTRHYVLNEVDGVYQVEEVVEKDYINVHALRAEVGYFGDRSDLETFDTVLEDKGLIEALKYYKLHRYDFDSESKSAFLSAAYDKLTGPIFQPEFTDIYDWGYEEMGSKLNVTRGNPVLKDLQDVYQLCKSYYAMEGQLDVMGYEYAVVDIETSKLINMIIYDRHLYSKQDDVADPYEEMRVDLVFTNLDDVLDYPFAYPRVVVEREDDLDKMRHEDIWKTWVLVPVDVTYGSDPGQDENKAGQSPYNFNGLQMGDKAGDFIIDEISSEPEGQKMFLAIGMKTFEGRIQKDIIMEDAYQFYSDDLAFGRPLVVDERLIETLDYAYIENQSIVASSLDQDLVNQLESGESVKVKAVVIHIGYNNFTGLSVRLESLEEMR